MTTPASNWVGLTRQHLQGTTRDELTTLGALLSSGGTSATLATPFSASIVAGALLGTELEVLQITGGVSSPTVNVARGLNGSVGASHANGTNVLVNPRFTDWAIFQALNDELASLSAPSNGLYQIPTPYNFAYSAAVDSYNLTLTGFIDVLDVRWQDVGPSNNWPIVRRYAVQRDADPTAFTGTVALRLYEPVMPGRTIHVIYKAEFTVLTDLTTSVATTGLPATAWDIPPLGAAARLLMAREARRSAFDTQPESRQATDVPPGAARSAAQGLLALRNQRILEEAGRLNARHPMIRRSA